MERYNVRHSCGHLETITARHGITRDTWDTQRFLASVPCDACKRPGRYTIQNLDNGAKRILDYQDRYNAEQKANEYISRGANRVVITDTHTGEQIIIAA